MASGLSARLLGDIGCEVREDGLSRQLYATDASIYQLAPRAVALPRSAEESATAMQAAAAAGLAVTPRGAGSGLAGGALGDGLVIDLSRYNRGISDFNREAATVRAEAGVVLDQLNAFLQPHGLTFGPDVATSSRATLGGMIASNSSGARAPLYGATIDHVRSVEAVLADGRVVELGLGKDGLQDQRDRIEGLIAREAHEIRSRFHDGICKRWPGYGLDRCLKAPRDLSKLMGGSEGTLATIFSAELSLVPLPLSKGVGLIFFASAEEALEATVDLLDFKAAGIEHIDDVLFDQTRGQLQFQAARDLLELDSKPCRSILLVEFYEEAAGKLDRLAARNLGLRTHICRNSTEMAHVMNLRKAGLSLLTGCAGPAKPTAGIEDVAVRPDKMPAYAAGLREILKPLGLRASFYGHAASGLLHVRPVVDLHRAEDIAKFRQVADGVAALTKQFKGSLTAEHGVGIARTEYVADQVGPVILGLMRQIKTIFDPEDQMNPGKIFDDGRYRIDTNLRQGADAHIDVPFDPVLAFAAKDGSFVGNLEQCNGCGGCRKDEPTMCPTFIATGDDLMATRGRANVIRAVLEGRLGSGQSPVLSPELDEAISNCLSCKACKTECPSNVDMALLKAELLYARMRDHGVPLGARVVSRVDRLSVLASLAPGLANRSLQWGWVRLLMQRFLGISTRRPLPTYAAQRFDHWFRRRVVPAPRGTQRGTVLLWDDCFVRHNEPHIGMAATRVLEAAGYRVKLIEGRSCCGRPAFSTGRLDVARRFGEQNIALLRDGGDPIIFLEPSCYSMFRQDYEELKVSGATEVAPRAHLFEDFVGILLDETPDTLRFSGGDRSTAIHAHCHAKALTDAGLMPRLAERIPGNDVSLLDTGCCGMAGQFGALDAKYDLSVKVGEDLAEKVMALAPETRLVASGTSCRHQITHLTDTAPLHMAELLAEALLEDTV